MTPAERRWKWVRPSELPEDLQELMAKLSKKKSKKQGEKLDRHQKRDHADSSSEEEFVTVVKTRDELTTDYSLPLKVKESLEVLTQERFKGKFSSSFHVQVLSRMADMMLESDNLSEIKLKVNVLVYLIGTFIQSVKTVGVLNRTNWLMAVERMHQLLILVQKP